MLLYCLGISPTEMSASRIEQLSTEQWNEIIKLADRHYVLPLLYHRLKIHNPDITIPASVEQELRESYLDSSWKNIRRYHELAKVLQILQNEGIPVILLKGAALATLVYQDIALRPMCDVDLLVKGEDIWQTGKILLQLGYGDFSLLSSKRYSQYTKHTTHASGRACIEVHPKIYELPHLDPWINASPAAAVSTDNTFILGVEDFLLHLCLHLDDHYRGGRHRLIWWYDIAEILNFYREVINWSYVIRVAREHQVGEDIHRVLYMVDESFHADVPAEVFSQLGNGCATVSINDVLNSGKTQDRDTYTISSFRSTISGIPSIHGKIYYIFRKIFPRREYMRCHPVTHSNRAGLHYFTRIVVNLRSVIRKKGISR